MEVKAKRFLLSLRPDLEFAALGALVWWLFFRFVEPSVGVGAVTVIFYIIGAIALAALILQLMGYFDVVHILLGRNDLTLLVFAVPLGGVLQHTLFHILSDIHLFSLRLLLIWSPLISAAVYGTYTFLFPRSDLRGAKRRKVVLELSAEQHARIVEDFRSLGLDRQIDFITVKDLQAHLLRAAAGDIDLIVISRDAVKQFDEDGWLVRAHLAGIPVVDYREVATRLIGRIRLDDNDLWTYLLLATPQTRLMRAMTQAKLVLEPLAALVLLVLFSPLMLLIALVIKRTSSGPVFYLQARTGFMGRSFRLVKFRSMYLNSEVDGPRWASENDSRVTPIGKILRRTRLDELPQLWNVVKGEMGFFGPRPERPEIHNALRKDIPLFNMRTIVRPGITGWAQVCAGYAASVEESRLKLEYDLYYIQHMSLRLDLIILMKTIRVALFGDKASQTPDAAPAAKVGEIAGPAGVKTPQTY